MRPEPGICISYREDPARGAWSWEVRIEGLDERAEPAPGLIPHRGRAIALLQAARFQVQCLLAGIALPQKVRLAASGDGSRGVCVTYRGDDMPPGVKLTGVPPLEAIEALADAEDHLTEVWMGRAPVAHSAVPAA
jgi:hypothetical protein